jgi:hypothetical protein
VNLFEEISGFIYTASVVVAVGDLLRPVKSHIHFVATNATIRVLVDPPGQSTRLILEWTLDENVHCGAAEKDSCE